MATVDELILRVRIDNQASAQLGNLVSQTKQLNSTTQQAGSQGQSAYQRLNASVERLSATLSTKALNATINFVKESVKAYGEYQQGMASIAKTVDATAGQLSELGTKLREATINDLKGTSTLSQLQEIAAMGGKFGVVIEDLDKFTVSTAKMAKLWDLSVAKTGESTAKLIAQYDGLEAKQIENIGSVIDYVADSSATSESFILNFAQRVSGIANLTGQSLADISATAATIAVKTGMAAEAASGAYMDVMNKMTTDMDTFARLMGKTTDEWTKIVTEDGDEAFNMLLERLEQIKLHEGVKSYNEAIKEMFGGGKRVKQLLDGMVGTYEQNRDAIRKANEEFAKGTRVSGNFAKSIDTQNASFAKLTAIGKDILTMFGEQFAPTVNGSLGLVTQGALSVREGLQDLFAPEFWDEIVQYPEQVAVELSNVFKGQIGGLVDWFGGLGSIVPEGFWDALVPVKGFADLKQDFATLFSDIDTGFENAWSGITATSDATFDGIVADVQIMVTAIQEQAAAIRDAIVGPFVEAKAEVSDAFQEIKTMITGDNAPKLEMNAEQALADLNRLRQQVGSIPPEFDALNEKYKHVFQGLTVAMQDQREPSEQLKRQMREIVEEMEQIAVVGWEQSVFPAFQEQLRLTQGESQLLKGSLEEQTATIEHQEAVIKELSATSKSYSYEIRDINAAIGEQKRLYKEAGESLEPLIQQEKTYRQSIETVTAQIEKQKKLREEAFFLYRGTFDETIANLEQQKTALQQQQMTLENTLDIQKQIVAEEQDGINSTIESYQAKIDILKSQQDAISEQSDYVKDALYGEKDALRELEGEYNKVTSSFEQQQNKVSRVFDRLSDEAQEWLFSQKDLGKALNEVGIEYDYVTSAMLKKMEVEWEENRAINEKISALESLSGATRAQTSAIQEQNTAMQQAASFAYTTSGVTGIDDYNQRKQYRDILSQYKLGRLGMSQSIDDYYKEYGGFSGYLAQKFPDMLAMYGKFGTSMPALHSGGIVKKDYVQRFHTGGGLKSDEVPAILQTGEVVLSRQHVQQMQTRSQQPVVNNFYITGNVLEQQAFDGFVRQITETQRRQQKMRV